MTRAEYENYAEENGLVLFSAQMAVKAVEAMNKQTPRKVLYSGCGYFIHDTAQCPSCGYECMDDGEQWEMPYCARCGQALEWG